MLREDDLFARVVADLADDTPRVVLADHWLELGNPRGEFVALQLKVNRGEGNRTDRARMTKLKEAHETEWLGALTNVAGFVLFHRGFLDELHVATPDLLAAAAESRELGTVRFLRRGSILLETYSAILFSPALVNVQSADVPLELLDDVLARPPSKLRRVALESAAMTPLDEQVRAVKRSLAGASFEEIVVAVPMNEDAAQYCRAVLPLATSTTGIVVSTRRAECRASRRDGGLELHIPNRDRRLAAAARQACPDAVLV